MDHGQSWTVIVPLYSCLSAGRPSHGRGVQDFPFLEEKLFSSCEDILDHQWDEYHQKAADVKNKLPLWCKDVCRFLTTVADIGFIFQQ